VQHAVALRVVKFYGLPPTAMRWVGVGGTTGLLPAVRGGGWRLGPVVVAHQARVALGDAVAGGLRAGWKVVGVWRDVVMNHPALAVVLLGVYEILVAMLLFAGKIATDLQERWRPRIVDRVDRVKLLYFTQTSAMILAALLAGSGFLPQDGSIVGDAPKQPQDAIFVYHGLPASAGDTGRELPVRASDAREFVEVNLPGGSLPPDPADGIITDGKCTDLPGRFRRLRTGFLKRSGHMST